MDYIRLLFKCEIFLDNLIAEIKLLFLDGLDGIDELSWGGIITAYGERLFGMIIHDTSECDIRIE